MFPRLNKKHKQLEEKTETNDSKRNKTSINNLHLHNNIELNTQMNNIFPSSNKLNFLNKNLISYFLDFNTIKEIFECLKLNKKIRLVIITQNDTFMTLLEISKSDEFQVLEIPKLFRQECKII